MKKRQITKTINKWLLAQGIELKVKHGKEFSYNPNTKVIEWTFDSDKRQDRYFDNFCKENGLKHKCYDFVLSILHEVGHNKTENRLTDTQYERCLDTKVMLAFMEESKRKNYIYFNLKDEKLATKWAIRFYNKHFQECEQLQREINKLRWSK